MHLAPSFFYSSLEILESNASTKARRSVLMPFTFPNKDESSDAYNQRGRRYPEISRSVTAEGPNGAKKTPPYRWRRQARTELIGTYIWPRERSFCMQ